jgi:hypothetical protein
LGRDQLAQKLNYSGPKITAAIIVLKLKEDPECFKHIKIGKVTFDRYSQKAIEKISVGLENKTIDDIWKEYKKSTQ